ncbi:MAG: glycoside hydrolase family 127 protein [Candidatus Helarchaeota archaeon]
MNLNNSYKHVTSRPLSFGSIKIKDTFWSNYRDLIRKKSIPFQLRMLKKTGTIDNFRIVAGLIKKFRRGFFYCDSDLYKWLEAASYSLALQFDKKLEKKINEIIDILKKAQDIDGYLFTYNQIHFPWRKWTNFQIEHELYCSGHLIEAGIAHHIATGKNNLLKIAMSNADLIMNKFQKCLPNQTPGHQEIELALIKLFRQTNNVKYLELAQCFIEQRGKISHFYKEMLKNAFTQFRCNIEISKQKKQYMKKYGAIKDLDLTDNEFLRIDPLLVLRALFSFLTGRYNQQNKPIRKQSDAIGHAVRFTYYMAGIADLYIETGDVTLLRTLKRLWNNMVQRRMYVTGGLGALSIIEGFGRDYELPNKNSYCETCAAIGSLLWNMRMTLITRYEKYADLFERQLYNAMLVGLSQDGLRFTYSNPLQSKKGILRKKWFLTPCCPPNVARIIMSLQNYIYSINENSIFIHQYIGSKAKFSINNEEVEIRQESQFPWKGLVEIRIKLKNSKKFNVNIRIPDFSNEALIKINDEEMKFLKKNGKYHQIMRTWNNGDMIKINFPMKPSFIWSHPKVKVNRKHVAIRRGPIIYCLESIDNPELNLSKIKISTESQIIEKTHKFLSREIIILIGKLSNGEEFKAIPYFYTANRGLSAMQLWIHYE